MNKLEKLIPGTQVKGLFDIEVNTPRGINFTTTYGKFIKEENGRLYFENPVYTWDIRKAQLCNFRIMVPRNGADELIK